MAAERSHLLVLGVRGSELGCPGTFASRLVGEVEEEEEQQPLLPWTLTTKYYRAELAVHVRHAELLEGRLAAHEVLASVAEEEGGPHGVVIVVDGRDGSGMQAWRPWLEAVAERGPELCLCVGIVPSAEDGEHARAERQERQEELMRERTLWCLESGFEYVEVEAGEVEGGGPDISTSSTSTLDQQECRRHGRLPPELREKEGMERVRESIEATPWPTLVRVPREVPAAEAVGGKGEDCMFAAVEGGKSVEGREGPQEGAGEGEEAGACRSKKGSRADDGDDDNEDNDDQDDNLEALFEKIRSVRESALRGGSGVEDEERRARAAMAALELARVLGLDDGEGD